MTQNFTQQLKNLPDEILSQPRFFAVGADKQPLTKGWSKPENQKYVGQIQGLAGFDTAGHGTAEDYLFLDFDHILDNNGNFINDVAQHWFNKVHDELKSYCELSASEHGAHIIAKPTKDKFKKISSGKNGKIDFGNGAFLEIFYKTGGRYCLFTGNVYQCEQKARITHGETADRIFQILLDEIDKRNQLSLTKQQRMEAKLIYDSKAARADDDRERALNMLAVIPVAELSREDWINVGMALKNNGNTISDWEQWSRADERFKDGECETLWQGFSYGGGLTIATIHDIAKKYGYQEPKREHFVPVTNDEPQEKCIWTQDIIKSCPVNLRMPQNFIWTKNSIIQLVPSKKDTEDFKYLPVAKTLIVPTKEFREPNSGRVEYEVAILSRGHWQNVIVDGKTLGEARLLTELCNYGAIIDEPSRLKQFLNAIRACNPNLAQIKTYKQTGWTSSDCDTFAYPTGGDDYIVRRAGFDYEEIFKPKGDPDKWKQKFVEVTEQGGTISHITIGSALASPLVRPLGLPNIQVHIEGKRGIGKSALPEFAASIYGDPSPGAMTRTFSASLKNRLELASAFCDLPQILDELETLSKREEDSLPQSIYEYSLGIANQAQRRDGTARETKRFSGARISTGERSILKHNDKGGAYKRVLNLRTKTLFEDSFAFTLHNFCKRNRGLFGKLWINYINKNIALIESQFDKVCKTIKNRYVDIDPTQLKSLVVSALAYQHFKICIGLQNLATDADTINAELTADLAAIIEILPTTAEIDDTARAIAALGSYVGSHEKSFTRDEKDSNTDTPIEIGAWGTVCSGKIFDTGAIAFFPTELKRILEDELKFASADKLIAEWRDMGNILKTDKGQTTRKIRIGKKTYRVYYFQAGVLSSDADSAETSYYESLGVI